MTECTGTSGDTNWPAVFNFDIDLLYIAQTRYGAVTVLLWNLVLNEMWGPAYEGEGGCKNCRGIITLYSDDTHFERSIEYHIIGHMNKAASSGAVRVESPNNFGNSGSLVSVAFLNPDNTTGIVVFNKNETESEDLEVRLGGQTFLFEKLGPLNAVTFRL